MQTGGYFGERLSRQQAKSLILKDPGNQFDPEIILIFADILNADEAQTASCAELIVPFENLIEGMILSQDVLMTTGLILLRKGKALSSGDIEALARVINLYPSRIQFYVRV